MDIPPATMNITYRSLKNTSDHAQITCPRCKTRQVCKHGTYQRKGFHARGRIMSVTRTVKRYRCKNPLCTCCTFSVLPPGTLRYCRFSCPGLIALKEALRAGASPYHLARYVWHVGREVITRAAAQFARLTSFIASLHQELTDGAIALPDFVLLVNVITEKIGMVELNFRWYRHRYGARFKR